MRATRTAMAQIPPIPLVVVLNGPNLNMLGLRQPALYGAATLDDVEALCAETADATGHGHRLSARPTHEGELITWVQEARGKASRHRHQPGRLQPPPPSP